MQADDVEWSPVNKVMKNFDSTEAESFATLGKVDVACAKATTEAPPPSWDRGRVCDINWGDMRRASEK